MLQVYNIDDCNEMPGDSVQFTDLYLQYEKGVLTPNWKSFTGPKNNPCNVWQKRNRWGERGERERRRQSSWLNFFFFLFNRRKQLCMHLILLKLTFLSKCTYGLNKFNSQLTSFEFYLALRRFTNLE